MKKKVKRQIPDTKKPRFYVEDDEGKFYIDNIEQFLISNDPILCGVEFMTDKEFSKIPTM
jgi:hypothetical protein